MKPRKIIIVLILFCVTSFAQTLKIGVTPYTSAMKIIKIYEPMTTFLSNALGMKVEVYSSKDYKQFYHNTQDQDFDIIITSPHFGVLHMQNGFSPIYRYDAALNLLFLVHKDSPYQKISDLKNTTIATPNALSALNIGSVKALLDYGLEVDKNITIEDLGSHTSGIKCVLIKNCAAAITTYSPLKQFTDQESLKQTRILKSDFKMPHLFTLASPKLPKEQVQKIKEALEAFEKSAQGKVFFEKTGYNGYVDISQKDVSDLLPVSSVTKQYLGVE